MKIFSVCQPEALTKFYKPSASVTAAGNCQRFCVFYYTFPQIVRVHKRPVQFATVVVIMVFKVVLNDFLCINPKAGVTNIQLLSNTLQSVVRQGHPKMHTVSVNIIIFGKHITTYDFRIKL